MRQQLARATTGATILFCAQSPAAAPLAAGATALVLGGAVLYRRFRAQAVR